MEYVWIGDGWDNTVVSTSPKKVCDLHFVCCFLLVALQAGSFLPSLSVWRPPKERSCGDVLIDFTHVVYD
jgi:hypothetical protein